MIFNAAKKRQGYIILYRIGLKDMHMIFPILSLLQYALRAVTSTMLSGVG